MVWICNGHSLLSKCLSHFPQNRIVVFLLVSFELKSNKKGVTLKTDSLKSSAVFPTARSFLSELPEGELWARNWEARTSDLRSPGRPRARVASVLSFRSRKRGGGPRSFFWCWYHLFGGLSIGTKMKTEVWFVGPIPIRRATHVAFHVLVGQ